jgi:hypothetical protein
MIPIIIVSVIIVIFLVSIFLPQILVWWDIKQEEPAKIPPLIIAKDKQGHDQIRVNKPRALQEIEFAEMAMLAERSSGNKCHKCMQRGYESWDIELLQYIPCICVIKAANKAKLQKRTEKKGAMN